MPQSPFKICRFVKSKERQFNQRHRHTIVQENAGKKRERGYKKVLIEGTQNPTRIAEGFLPPPMTIQNKIPNFPKTIHKVKKHPPALFISS